MSRFASLLFRALSFALLAGTALTAEALRPSSPSNRAVDTPKVLLVISGEGRKEADKLTRPGFEMDELSQAWLVLRKNGIEVEIASPRGGPVVADRYDSSQDHNALFLHDQKARTALAATRPLSEIKPGEHAAIFIIGGKGAMFDLPVDANLMSLLQHHQGLLAAVCHGPAALVVASDFEGRPLVQGVRITGFTDEEERTFGKTWATKYPFWIETRARQLGALWEEAPLMMPKVVRDGRIITGQNPASTVGVAEALVLGLGRTPVTRTPFLDERTMSLVQRWLAGEKGAVQAQIAAEPQQVRIELVALLGYYQFNSATDDTARAHALALMQMAEPHFQHPQFVMQLARAYALHAQRDRAHALLKARLAQGISDLELRQQAEKLLTEL
jgi:putative intracellular protease/amidase